MNKLLLILLAVLATIIFVGAVILSVKIVETTIEIIKMIPYL